MIDWPHNLRPEHMPLGQATPLRQCDTEVPVPTNADQAAAMVLLGMDYLKRHAPHRLKDLPRE